MATKYIFITGGVVSGIGKGITAAVLGCLLKARGLHVLNQKFDPYINIDPGMMSPTQHGEVFITDDGAETDLDIGHYERFTDSNLDCTSDITTGMIYRDILQRERDGGYSGTTVQVVPHIINEIKTHIFQPERKEQPDILIAEVGGTVGDMESLPYLEAIRQVSYQVGHENVLFIHVTLIPYLRSSGETKTKPTQHSVQKLRSLGIQPDILVCRCEKPIEHQVREKISLYCNVDVDCVIQNQDVPTVYQLPLLLEKEGLATQVCRKLNLEQCMAAQPDLGGWERLAARTIQPARPLRIALVGKYLALQDAYLSILEALKHAGLEQGVTAEIDWVSAEDLAARDPDTLLRQADAILVPGGFGPRGMEGMIVAAAYARRRKIPFLGIGLGMQMAVVDFARCLAGITDAHSAECEAECSPIFILPAVKNHHEVSGAVVCSANRPMRRGSYECVIQPGTRLADAYKRQSAAERHHHRWELNPAYRETLAQAGLIFSGLSPDGSLVEAIELKDHPWFVGVVFHPEFKSRPTKPHPLFLAFIAAALDPDKAMAPVHGGM
ncbi:MAG: CTP synthase [Clostridiaceae bacterium]|nr:CTP synthase [Clostridiaceae bacterium]